jgi:ATP-binding cassette, subfamily F, member 3
MLQFNHLALRRGARLLIDDLDLTLHAGQRVGVTGANGCGKSTLFALVRGEMQPDRGDFFLPAGLTIAEVAQETPADPRAAIEYALDGDGEWRTLDDALQQAEKGEDGHRVAELHDRLAAIDGYTTRSRAARLLHGLGFSSSDEQRPVASFSGGWRMRLNLARALMCRSDLLLLDEPTNHLDLDAIVWLEGWLASYRGTLLLISHDRDFLDSVVHHILHIEHGQAHLYAGNYSDFEVLRAERLAQQQALHERQQRERAHIQAYIDRFRVQATKARQAQSRIKALARMELIAPAHADSPFTFDLLPPDRLPNPLLKLDHAAAGYGAELLLHEVGLVLTAGDRVGLLGRNGAGKSTLIKLLAGEMVPLAGKRTAAQDLRIGYFAQHQLEQLRLQDSALLQLQRLDPRASEQTLRDWLGSFGFHGDQALQPVAPFSGGEKARLVLALLIYQRPNLLLLDEPTNHLDLEMRHALTMALQGFEGAMVIVSHDRHLLRSCADSLLLVDGGRVTPFEGDLEEYRQWLSRRESVEPPRGATTTVKVDRKADRRDGAERRKERNPLKREVDRWEKAMADLAAKKRQIEQKMADPAIYEAVNKAKLLDLMQRQAAIDSEMAAAEEQWLAASEALEAFDA